MYVIYMYVIYIYMLHKVVLHTFYILHTYYSFSNILLYCFNLLQACNKHACVIKKKVLKDGSLPKKWKQDPFLFKGKHVHKQVKPQLSKSAGGPPQQESVTTISTIKWHSNPGAEGRSGLYCRLGYANSCVQLGTGLLPCTPVCRSGKALPCTIRSFRQCWSTGGGDRGVKGCMDSAVTWVLQV